MRDEGELALFQLIPVKAGRENWENNTCSRASIKAHIKLESPIHPKVILRCSPSHLDLRSSKYNQSLWSKLTILVHGTLLCWRQDVYVRYLLVRCHFEHLPEHAGHCNKTVQLSSVWGLPNPRLSSPKTSTFKSLMN
ncbi:hypothetical protein J6590_011320 [Homalodisca vitripennis]|nr:hypothetical protein J6590_011320 [Homalodisca vitripennis]